VKVLILGGTVFVGRHLAPAFFEAGHRVTVFNRGKTPNPLPAGVKHLGGDRDQGLLGLDSLAGGTWDLCIDTSGYTPSQVRPSLSFLVPKVGRYLYVSAVMTYGDTQLRPVTEDNPLVLAAEEEVTTVDGETYGPLKVACENPVKGPGDGTDHVQFVDVTDLARFAVLLAEKGISGTFQVAGHRVTWAEFLNLLGAKAVLWGPPEPDLPLYRPEHGLYSGLMHLSTARAQANGFVLTDLPKTLATFAATLLA
jgi:2'-hydroxyisoflavone reductase